MTFRDRSSSPLVAGVVLIALGYAAVFVYAVRTTGYEIVGGLVVGPTLIALTLPVVVALAWRETDRRVTNVILAGYALKLAASVARYFVAFEVYDAIADATGYHGYGMRIAAQLRTFDLDLDLGAEVVGIGFMRLLTGIVYLLTGPTKLGGFLVFAFLGFVGMYLFYRAFTIAVPDGDRLRYAALVFLLPSLLYWPSSIGKESWMMLVLGLAAYGAAKLLAGRSHGLLLLVLGLAGTSIVRPHVALLVVTALGAGTVVSANLPRPAAMGSGARHPTGRMLLAVVVIVAGAFVTAQVEAFFAVDDLDVDTANQIITDTARQTATGGSEFAARRVNSPADVPVAVVSVLFRPFPFEAHNPQALFASFEGVLLMYLVWRWRHDLRTVPRRVRTDPYVAFAASYSLLFVTAFSSFGNFGLIARERTQLFPLILVLLALGAGTVERSPRPARMREG